MALKRKTEGQVYRQQQIAPGIYDLWVETDLADDAAAGQFVGVFPHNKATLLPRPISICECDQANGRLRLVYRVAGSGTAEFAAYWPGDRVSLLGVLGNGFPVAAAKGKRIFLMGGGIGIPPLLELAKAVNGLAAEVRIFVGYRDGQLFLQEDLQRYGTVHVATEDGSIGIKGNVMDALRGSQRPLGEAVEVGGQPELITDSRQHAGGIKNGGRQAEVIMGSSGQPELIMACGPMPMLRAIKHYAADAGIEAYISLEERMACGVGACLGCACKTAATDHHSHVNNARICTDGPVFAAGEVDI